MKMLNLRPKVFERFLEVKTEFVIDQMNQPTTLTQEHGSHIVYVGNLKGEPFAGDGAFTDKMGLKLTVRTADCLPILFYNSQARVIGVVHAGWRGTAKEILKNAVTVVMKRFNAKAGDFYFYFGPAAQNCCYKRDFVQDNLRQLRSLGVPENHIENCGTCTIHNRDYPSHRRERDKRTKVLYSSMTRI